MNTAVGLRTEFERPELLQSVSPSGWFGFLSQIYRVSVPRVRNWFKKELPDKQIRIVLKEIFVHVDAADDGTTRATCIIVNLAKETWELDHVEVLDWTVHHYGMPSYPNWITATGSLAPRSLTEISFKMRLGGPEVRRLVNYLTPAESHLSTGGTSMKMDVRFVLRAGKRIVPICTTLEEKSALIYVPASVINEIRPS